jgi:tRNA-splicing ligase RtcB
MNNVKEINEKTLEKLDEIGKEYHLFINELEDSALEQFMNCLSEPSVVKGALMPDAHTGYSLCIGGVIASKDHIFPAFVGMDIGCGLGALKTSFKKDDIIKKENLIYQRINSQLPVGRGKNRDKKIFSHNHNISKKAQDIFDKKGGDQLGTLGGGNHFLELGYDDEDNVWIIVHSGSRGVGGLIAEHYIDLAYRNSLNLELRKLEFEEYFRNEFVINPKNKNILIHNPIGYETKMEIYVKTNVEKNIEKLVNVRVDNIQGNHSFHVDSDNGLDYIRDLNFSLDFALANRKEMISVVHNILNKCFDTDHSLDFETEGVFINRNHNHAELKDDLWIHRKGATHAEAGMYGVIPGNMRDGSFIVLGKGNEKSLCSSSHGAGRVYSRKKAKKLLKLEDFKDTMKGIKAKIKTDTLDESPFAYKDIFEVMKNQEDLVEVVTLVKPLINIKG